MKKNIPLADYTTFKIGGPADYFVEAKTEAEINHAIKKARELKIPFFILGGGSNVLASDEGFRGMVIAIRHSQFAIRNSNILAAAGLSLRQLLLVCKKNSLTGLEFLAGIPGTVGGAIRGNAGAWQQAIGDKVIRVKILTPPGKKQWLSQKECDFAYRQSRFKKTNEIILGAELKLSPGKSTEINQNIDKYLQKRASQPKQPSAGCVFINPKPKSAGELIDQCDLKGKQINDAQISPYHANFIVNLSQAKAKDVIALIKLAQQKVKKKFGIDLKLEIQIMGKHG